ncbi:MAG: hypothetical protein JRI25_17090, partial [Deltaproteobacteria bacterium]|nr:hypothetical protein [Deltaproteobacteria bacterium]
MRIWLATLIMTLAACKAPPEAPEELDELSKYLYREWGNEDPEVIAVGLAELVNFLDGLDLEGPLNDRSFTIGPAGADTVQYVDIPEGRDPDDTVGVSVARASEYAVTDHARLQTEVDQLPTEPTASEYVRRFIEPTDPVCFVDHACDVMRTENDIRRNNLVISVSFVLYKEFRWSELPDDGGWGFLSRSWTDQVWYGNSGNTSIQQSYSLDVWLPAAGDTTWRYQLVWSESDTAVNNPNLIAATLKNSSDNTIAAG